ncbi:MAG: CaiB/BaiF CoA-transferase family protein [Gammaproteobacteria bacterium]|jgi:crotonobetainyl-CoA:carnitine CoA-transferase CaiB-like acyl-CoA transferase
MLRLDEILVVSLEQAVAAPFCSNRLARAGARVIKVERPEGDFARGYDSVVHGESAYFVWLNQGKESLVLDIKNPADADLLRRILECADVFIQNLAPGAAARAGFGSEQLRAEYPRLVCCDISGYGSHGEYSRMKAYDLLVQCESGVASITGTPEAPGRIGVSACDINCGQQAYTAILEALIARESSGAGCVIEVSLFDSMAEWLAVPLLHYDYGGTVQQRVGLNHANISPYGAYRCGDGLDIVIAIQNEREWQRFCELVLGDADLARDPRLESNQVRVANRAYVDELVGGVFAGIDQDRAVDLLQRADIAYGRLNDMAGLSAHPQLRRGRVETPSGEARVVEVAAIRRGVAGRELRVPALGEHNEAIRKEFT